MPELLPDRLKAAWQRVEAGALSAEGFAARQEQELREYRQLWSEALRMPGEKDLAASLIGEIARFAGCDLAEADRRCRAAVIAVAEQWKREVDRHSRASIERYYDRSEPYLYDLMWWHALEYDEAPLAYVAALEFARKHGLRTHLDFGSGVGAGAILFGRHGFGVALADISSALLDFCRWRLEQRGQPAALFDLKRQPLPDAAFDIITAMDVFEHLVDPVAAIDPLHRALRPGGFLFGRFHAEVDESHPQHIVFDFAATYARLAQLGFVEVWRDDWLWGHQVFQKAD